MHILHVTRETGSDSRYGLRKSLLPVLDVLQLRGHTVELFDQDLAASAPVHSLARMVERFYLDHLQRKFGGVASFYLDVIRERIRVSWAAVQHARRTGVTQVHCHDPLLAHAFGFFARWLGIRIKWGYTQHAFGRYVQPRVGLELPQAVAAHLGAWETTAARNAHWVVVPSRSGMEQLAADLGFSTLPPHWHLVPHPRPSFVPGGGAAIRARFGIGNSPLLLAVGQLIPMKRFYLLIEAVAQLPVHHQPHLLILGEGWEEAALRELAAVRGLAGRFHVTATDEMAPFLDAADAYVSVSSTESYGMANCEALAAGLPSICTAVGAVREVVGSGGCLIDESVHGLVEQLTRLLDSPDERHALADRARRQVAQWWDAEQVARALEAIYANKTRNII